MSRSLRTRTAALGAVVLLAIGGIAGGVVVLTSGADGSHALAASAGPGAVDVDESYVNFAYEIPAGTGAKLARGVKVSLLPARIVANVGQVIRIQNRDDRGYLLGPFYVGPHETLSQRFTSPGTYTGTCAVHPGGTLKLVVES